MNCVKTCIKSYMEAPLSKALVFGGAFNPPTIAHIALAKYAKEKAGVDHVIFVPSKMSYITHEQNKDFAFKDTVRLEMLQTIAQARSWMLVCDHELKSPTQPRTYQTLLYLKQQGYTCRLLFGSDKLSELETGWKHVTNIAEEFGIACMERNEDDCFTMIQNNTFLSSLKNIEIIETPPQFQHISSTKVRKLFVEKKYDEIDALVPKELNGLRTYSIEKDTI